jgi:uncharacterized protein (DUF1800 family)
MTGRTVKWADWTYTYTAAWHATGPVTVLGFSDPNPTAAGGEALGDAYVDYLSHHPATAQRVARKLCLRYVSDAPSQSLVDQVAAVYLANDTAILPTVYAIVRSDEFWAARGAKTRRPAENLIATIRAIGAVPAGSLDDAIDTVEWNLQDMNNDALNYGPPPGYPDVAAAWRSAGNMIITWNFHRAVVQHWWSQWQAPDLTALLGSPAPATAGAAITALANRLVGQPLTAADQQTLLDYTGDAAATPWSGSHARSMLAGLVVLILDSPYHALR